MNLLEQQNIQLTFNYIELQSNGHFKSFAGMNIDFFNQKRGSSPQLAVGSFIV